MVVVWVVWLNFTKAKLGLDAKKLHCVLSLNPKTLTDERAEAGKIFLLAQAQESQPH